MATVQLDDTVLVFSGRYNFQWVIINHHHQTRKGRVPIQIAIKNTEFSIIRVRSSHTATMTGFPLNSFLLLNAAHVDVKSLPFIINTERYKN